MPLIGDEAKERACSQVYSKASQQAEQQPTLSQKFQPPLSTGATTQTLQQSQKPGDSENPSKRHRSDMNPQATKAEISASSPKPTETAQNAQRTCQGSLPRGAKAHPAESTSESDKKSRAMQQVGKSHPYPVSSRSEQASLANQPKKTMGKTEGATNSTKPQKPQQAEFIRPSRKPESAESPANSKPTTSLKTPEPSPMNTPKGTVGSKLTRPCGDTPQAVQGEIEVAEKDADDRADVFARSPPNTSGAHLNTFFPAISSTKSGKYQTLSKARGLHFKVPKNENRNKSRYTNLKDLRCSDEAGKSRSASSGSSVTLGRSKQGDATATCVPQDSAVEAEEAEVVDEHERPQADTESAQTTETLVTPKKKKKTLTGTEKRRKRKAAQDEAASADPDKLVNLFLPATDSKDLKEEDRGSESTSDTESPLTVAQTVDKLPWPVEQGGYLFYPAELDTPNTGVWVKRFTPEGQEVGGYEYWPNTGANNSPASRYDNIHGFDDLPVTVTIFRGISNSNVANEGKESKDKMKETLRKAKEDGGKDEDGQENIGDGFRRITDGSGNRKVIAKRKKFGR